MKTKLLIPVLFILTLSSTIFSTIVNSSEIEDGITQSDPGIYNEDYLFLGKGLNFTGEAEDLYFAGEKLNFSGRAKSGIVALGKDVMLKGSAKNGIISGSKNIVIEDSIIGTNFIASKDLTIGKRAVVSGDIFAGAGNITIDGEVNGNLYAAAGKIIINGQINGDVKAYGGRLILSETGSINGQLTYGTKEKLSEAELTRVSGEVTYKKDKDIDDFHKFPKVLAATFGAIFSLIFIVTFIFIGFFILYLPVFSKLDTPLSNNGFKNTALWGILPIVMYPAIIVFSFIMILTIPFSLMMILAAFPLFYIAYIIGATRIGQLLSKRFNWNVHKRQFHFLIGAVAAGIISIIPVIDILVFLLLSSLGWGTYLSVLLKREFDTSTTTTITEL